MPAASDAGPPFFGIKRQFFRDPEKDSSCSFPPLLALPPQYDLFSHVEVPRDDPPARIEAFRMIPLSTPSSFNCSTTPPSRKDDTDLIFLHSKNESLLPRFRPPPLLFQTLLEMAPQLPLFFFFEWGRSFPQYVRFHPLLFCTETYFLSV